jgi:hypothetical protein
MVGCGPLAFSHKSGAAILTGMADAPRPRWFHLTPDRLVLLLLAAEGLLWLSDRLGWPVWHKSYAVLTAIASVGVAFLVMLLWFIAAVIFRLRFQFSIRSLLVLTVAVALPCSWLAVEMKNAREQTEAVEAIGKLGGQVIYDWQLDANGSPTYRTQPTTPAWLRSLLGDYFFAEVVGVGKNAELEYLTRFTKLQGLNLRGTNVTDAWLKQLKLTTMLFRSPPVRPEPSRLSAVTVVASAAPRARGARRRDR